MRASTLGLICALGATLLLPACRPAPDRDVVLIMIDTLRRDHLGMLGYPRETTPHLDALFRKGTVFRRATSPSPCTVPAVRQVMISRHGYWEERPTLAEILRENGYVTGAVVSQHHFRTADGPLPEYSRGFTSFDVQGASEVDQWNMTSRDARQVSDRAIAWLDSHMGAKPVFLWLHYFDPHDPYEAPPEHRVFEQPAPEITGDRRRYLRNAMNDAIARASPRRKREIRARPNPSAHFGATFSPAQRETLRSYYDAEIRYTDEQIGRVIDHLDRKGALADTLVVVTADHGERLGEGDRWAHCQSLHGYEIDVPLLFHPRLPGRPGVDGEAVSTLDIAPTILQTLGIDYAEDAFDGIGLLERQPERLVYSVWREHHVVHDGRWKLYAANDGSVVGLFDIERDPAELHDLAASEPERAATLGARLEQASAGRVQIQAELEETYEALRAIGYIQ